MQMWRVAKNPLFNCHYGCCFINKEFIYKVVITLSRTMTVARKPIQIGNSVRGCEKVNIIRESEFVSLIRLVNRTRE